MGGFLAGFGGGLVVGTVVAPAIVGPLGLGVQFVVVLLLVFGGATALAVGGYHLGKVVRDELRSEGAVLAERGSGVLLGAAAALAVMWLAGSTLANAPPNALTASVHGSGLLAAADWVLPPAPPLITEVGRHLGDTREPSLFAGFEPPAPEPAELPDEGDVATASDAGRDAVVEILAEGCEPASAGSGVVVEDGVVVTNAHVIAGTDEPQVIEDGEARQATTLLFDPQLDVAVLEAPVTAEPLPLAAGFFERGETAAALGFPEPRRTYNAEPAVVLDRLTARGRDLFGEELVEREIYRLATDARPGGSGGPLVRPDGSVIGIMFGRAGNYPGVGYALATPAVDDRVDEALTAPEPVLTGECL
jgi:S1-C subfamily serine protease